MENANVNFYDLLMMIQRKEDIQHIIDSAYVYFGGPIMIADQTMQILAMTTQLPDDAVWQKAFREAPDTGMVNISRKSLFAYKRGVTRQMNGTDTCPVNRNLLNLWSVTASEHGETIASLFIPSSDYSSIKKEAFVSFGSLLHHVFFDTDRNYIDEKSRIFLSLLNPASKENQQSVDYNKLKKYLESLSHPCIMAVIPDKIDDMFLTSQYLEKKLNLLLGETYKVNYHSALLILTEVPHDKVKDSIENLAKEWSLKFGISWQLSSIDEIQKRSGQALNTVRTGHKFDPDQHVYFYDFWWMFLMLHQLAQITDLKDYFSPCLETIAQYDRKNNSSLLPTLYSLLLHGMHANETAEDLHVHKNTLCHRLERIKEIIGEESDNASLQTSLFFSYLIDFLLKEKNYSGSEVGNEQHQYF